MWDLGPLFDSSLRTSRRFRSNSQRNARSLPILGLAALVFLSTSFARAQSSSAATSAASDTPPRVLQAQRFLAQRGNPSRRTQAVAHSANSALQPRAATSSGSLVWQPLGPAAVLTPAFGLVSGRITSIAFDPSDTTGNHVFIGTTGGGLWASKNAAASAGSVQFAPLTDNLAALTAAVDGSISIGAVTVQPGGTGVVLAGTGDPNDALDSYYGAGILRSTDNGATWNLIPTTPDQAWRFSGEGFAGFAWSTHNPQLVVAAVSQARESLLTDTEIPNQSYDGLYYSIDSGAHWSLATIQDASGSIVQGPSSIFDLPNGNAVTSVVWNPIRQMFLAAVRYHGYYESADGVIWTRLSSQPGTGLTASMCPTNIGGLGSIACPIFRGALAVNPVNGDTFAWTVDDNNQDQGLWRDTCALVSGICGNQSLTFATQLNTASLEANVPLRGPVTIQNGDYNLVLAAIPSSQDTLLFAGDNDLWKCSLAAGCVWRNTTNATTCMSAQVGEYQHALAWNSNTATQMFVGNDSGLWRSLDAVAESGSVCNSSDASHFDNLNGGLGSLAEVESLSQVTTSPYTLLTGLGVNGSAGVKSTSGPTSQWPQVLSGEGGPVAIDPTNPANWYVNNQAGVSIYACSQSAPCTPAGFGTAPVVNDADVAGDGYTMTAPAPFLIDPLDPSQLLVGTCRVWRGPANGSPWTSTNAISGFLDRISSGFCNGNALIRSIAALPLPSGSEILYAGMYGSANGGQTLGGHILSAIFNPSSGTIPVWQDLTANPVLNDTNPFNAFALDISSIYLDPHDPTGATVYVTIEGIPSLKQPTRTVYRSTDAGAHWIDIHSTLPWAPANAIIVDPQDANTVYAATDVGVYFTRQISACTGSCWTALGAGLPEAPVTQLSASPSTVTPNVLIAGTYGRGIWQIPLLSAGTQFTTGTASPASLTFAGQPVNSASATQNVTVTNTGGIGLAIGSLSTSGDFTETDNCQNTVVDAGASCMIQVAFNPTLIGPRTGQVAVSANVAGGQLTVSLSGTGLAAYSLNVSPSQLDFSVPVPGQTSSNQTITVTNPGAANAADLALDIVAPFSILQTNCGTSLAANTSCTASIVFSPASLGMVSGSLAVNSSTFAPVTVALSGFTGATGTVQFTPNQLTFATTAVGSASASQPITITNNGSEVLSNLILSVSAGFQFAGTTCTSSLGLGASCTANVAFAPTAAGSQSGSLSVASSALPFSAQLPLTGTGFDFTVAPSGAASQTIASGQTATYTLQLAPADGAAATFSFSCGSLPAYTVCSFAPSSVSIPANTSGSVTVQIATGQSAAPAYSSSLHRDGTAPFLCGLLLLPIALRRRKRLLLLLTILFAVVAFTACSGSGGGTGGGGGGGGGTHTPPGTYSIVVTATADGLAHKSTLTLTVD